MGPPTDYRDGAMGTNLSGFPVKAPCLLLGTLAEGLGSKSSSTRWPREVIPEPASISPSSMHTTARNVPHFSSRAPSSRRQGCEPWEGSLAAAPDPEPRLSSQISEKRALSSLPPAGAQLWPYIFPQPLTFLDSGPLTSSPKTPAWRTKWRSGR